MAVHAAFVDIAQDERAAAIPPLHEVEGDVERVHVAVVRVVDEGASPPAVYHLQAHGNRFQLGHALGQCVGRHSQVEGNGSGGDSVLNRSVINKGNGERTFHPGENIIYSDP